MAQRPLHGLFWIEGAGAAATAILTVVTLISPEWIEFLFGIDPDAGSGLLEWATVVVLALGTLLLGLLARAERRHAWAEPSA